MNYIILFITRQQDSIISNNTSSVYISNNNSNESNSSSYVYGSSSNGITNSSSSENASSLASSKDYTYSTTFSDGVDHSSSYINSYNDFSNSYSINSSDYTQEPSNNQSSQNYSSTDYTSSSYFQTDYGSSTVIDSFSNNNLTQDTSGGSTSEYQMDSYNSNSNSNPNGSSSDNDSYIYYNLSSSSNPDISDNSNNILSSVITESLFLNNSDNVYSNMDNPENYFNNLIKPIRILDSKCSSRKGGKPSKFEPFSIDPNIPANERSKYNRIENFFITELQEWLSNSRIGTDLSSDIFNYIILNESFESTYLKIKKWVVSLYWSAYDAQEIDNRVKEMKLLEEESNFLKS